MYLSTPRQRKGRAVGWAVAALALFVAGFLAFHFLRRGGEADPVELRRLQAAALPAPAPAPEAGDWPQWRGPRRDGVSDETGLLTDWPGGRPRVLWQARSGEGFASFAVADGRVYTLLQDGGEEAAVCWDTETGKELWRFRYPCRYENSYGSGPRATPTVEGGHVYTVGATGILHCLKAASGEKVWRRDLLEEFNAPNLRWGVSFSPLVEGGLVFTNPGGPNGNSLAAFDKETGQLVWKALDDPAGYSSPIGMTVGGLRQILFFTGAGLASVSPADGRLYWHYPWETSYDCNIATPIVVGDYVFISSGYGKGCALLHVVPDGRGGLEARRVYENTRMKNHFSTCVLYNEHLYGFDDGNLACLELRTGKRLWQKRGFNKGSLLAADGHLLILGEYGKLALAEASPEEYREKASFQLTNNKCWSLPVLANGRLYLRDEEHVWCLDLRRR